MKKTIDLSSSNWETAESWDEIREFLKSLYEDNPWWIFRGLPDKAFRLRTSLDRAVEGPTLKETIYRKMLVEFPQGLNQFRTHDTIPETDDFVELQALMQHYGCPTILMDWTKSPYIAAFFAAQKAPKQDDDDGVIYALNCSVLYKFLPDFLAKNGILTDTDEYDRRNEPAIYQRILFYQNETSGQRGAGFGFVMPIEPRKKNVRLLVQQGLFTHNGKFCYTFEENLVSLLLDLEKREDIDDHILSDILLRIVLPKETKKRIQEDLFLMNISTATLFPGLEGYAKSFYQRILIDDERFKKSIKKIASNQSHLNRL